MKVLTPQQLLEAFDRALAEAARIAAGRREQAVHKTHGLAEDTAPFGPPQPSRTS